MSGEKARAATQGIQEMVMECQSRGPAGPDRSYFKILLIQFSGSAAVDPNCDMTPARKIDPDLLKISGDGIDGTNITAAFQLALDRLRPYMASLQEHPERTDHPLPLVILFSDGEHNVSRVPPPSSVADQIKKLSLDGESIVITAAGVSMGNDQPDEKTLRNVASPECYVHISNAQVLSKFISSVGSSGASRAKDVAAVIKTVQ